LAICLRPNKNGLGRQCSKRRDNCLAQAIPAARKEFHDAILWATAQRREALHGDATKIAQSISRQLLNQWLEEIRVTGRLCFGQHFGFPHQSVRVQIMNIFASRSRRPGEAHAHACLICASIHYLDR
jgi:hypothetical protein